MLVEAVSEGTRGLRELRDWREPQYIVLVELGTGQSRGTRARGTKEYGDPRGKMLHQSQKKRMDRIEGT